VGIELNLKYNIDDLYEWEYNVKKQNIKFDEEKE
jgi:hypothetical protein